MRLLIDGDAASQIETAVIFARKNNIMVHIYCDYNHEYESEYAQIHIVDQSPGSADYAIISFCKRGNILITNDIGLASIALAKGVFVLNNHGFIYTNRNITTYVNHLYIHDTARRKPNIHDTARRKTKKHNIRPDDINLKHPNTSFIESLNHVYRRAQEREGKDEKTLT